MNMMLGIALYKQHNYNRNFTIVPEVNYGISWSNKECFIPTILSRSV